MQNENERTEQRTPSAIIGRFVQVIAGLLAAGLLIVTASALLAAPRPSATSHSAASVALTPPDLEHLVFLTDDLANPNPGCDAVSIANLDLPDDPIRLTFHISPGRLALGPYGDLVVSASANRIPEPLASTLPFEEQHGGFLYVARWDGSAWSTERPIYDRELASMSAASVMDDGETVLAGLSGYRLVDVIASGFPNMAPEPPFGIGRLSLSSVSPHPDTPEVGTFEWGARRVLPGIPASILPSSFGRSAHVVSVGADGEVTLHTVSTDTLDDVTLPLSLAPLTELEERNGGTPWIGPLDPIDIDELSRYLVDTLDQGQGTLTAARSPDERWLVTSRGEHPSLNLVDLEARRATTVTLPSGFERAGGVAFNAAPDGYGRLAVHGLEMIGVFDLSPDGSLIEVDRFSGLVPEYRHLHGTPAGSIAWSADGGELIAAGTSPRWPTDDFLRFEVDSSGHLTLRAAIDSCDGPGGAHFGEGIPSDVLTANGLLAQAAPTEPSGPKPTRVSEAAARIHLPLVMRTERLSRDFDAVAMEPVGPGVMLLPR